MDISETIIVYDVKVGRCSKLNKYMYLHEYQRSRSFIDLCPMSLRFNIFKLLFLRNRLADWSQISCGASLGWVNEVCSNGHMTKIAAMPIYGKNMKNSSFLEPKGRWPWNVVSNIGCSSTTNFIQMMTLGWPWPILRQGQIRPPMLLYGKKLKQWIFLKLL